MHHLLVYLIFLTNLFIKDSIIFQLSISLNQISQCFILFYLIASMKSFLHQKNNKAKKSINLLYFIFL